ncbi:MMPL family transporter [Nocardioides litoris]|uniref:MMPL family transporter n=1 Tax=Nocardioides litoris TaxID=1926648 RepID=UPI00112301E9|nr:MMPL family transporter [Nocardioides litoris]
MATHLYRLGKLAFRRWPAFLAGWIVLLVALGGLAAAFSKPSTDAFTIPGIPSEEAADLQAELFPGSKSAFDQATVNVVVAAPEGQRLDQAPYAAAVGDLVSQLADGPQFPADFASPEAQEALDPVSALAGPAPEGAAATFANASADGRIGVISYAFDAATTTDVEPEAREAVLDAMAQARESGLEVEANGQGMAEFAPPGGTAELIGIGIALVVLVLTFGSLVAAGLPILSALFGVGIGLAGITALSAVADLGSSAPILATMIGLAVGIDYSLFILARYRNELEHTEDREEAVGIAVGTAGSAVVFAGLTVLIALAALSVVRIPFLTTMGLAAAATVLLAVLVALTLLPAVLGLLRRRAFGGQVRRYAPTREADGKVLNNGVRWARLVGRAPVAFALLVVVGLGALAIPLKDLYLAFPTDSTAASDTTQRKASDLLTEGFGPGREAPFQLVVDGRGITDDQQRQQAFDDVVSWAEGQDGVQAAADATALSGGAAAEGQEGQQGGQGGGEQGQAAPGGQAEAAQVPPGTTALVVPSYGPDDPRTKSLLEALRSGEGDIEQQTGTVIGITGLTAITTDVSDRLNGALPIYLAVVVGLAFLLLMIVFRSILVPLTATFGFVLSVLATLGVTVLIFQEGALGLMEGQPIVSFIPIFLIGVVFGLAMDYQVFLASRMREAHVHGASTREAVVDGFRSSARVVAAAAVIMTAVFSGFVLEDDAIIKSIGFALAAAVVLDAFVVRMVLIPALMYLMGDKAWWLPRWLDRLLPDVDVEGEKLQRATPGKHVAEPEPELAGR